MWHGCRHMFVLYMFPVVNQWRGGANTYDAIACAPERLSERGIGLSLYMLEDHFIDGYEQALDHIARATTGVK